MGPQLCSCGNQAIEDSKRRKEERFNGAATLQLRKPGPQMPHDHTPARFNGAATLQLRKLIATKFSYLNYQQLQWGRNFAVAETLPLPQNADPGA